MITVVSPIATAAARIESIPATGTLAPIWSLKTTPTPTVAIRAPIEPIPREPLEAVHDREQERDQRDEREDDLRDAGRGVDEPAVDQHRRDAEAHDPEEDGPEQRATTREGKPPGDGDAAEDQRGDEESRSAGPHRIELAERDPHEDGTDAAEDDHEEEQAERGPIGEATLVGGHVGEPYPSRLGARRPRAHARLRRASTPRRPRSPRRPGAVARRRAGRRPANAVEATVASSAGPHVRTERACPAPGDPARVRRQHPDEQPAREQGDRQDRQRHRHRPEDRHGHGVDRRSEQHEDREPGDREHDRGACDGLEDAEHRPEPARRDDGAAPRDGRVDRLAELALHDRGVGLRREDRPERGRRRRDRLADAAAQRVDRAEQGRAFAPAGQEPGWDPRSSPRDPRPGGGSRARARSARSRAPGHAPGSQPRPVARGRAGRPRGEPPRPSGRAWRGGHPARSAAIRRIRRIARRGQAPRPLRDPRPRPRPCIASRSRTTRFASSPSPIHVRNSRIPASSVPIAEASATGTPSPTSARSSARSRSASAVASRSTLFSTITWRARRGSQRRRNSSCRTASWYFSGSVTHATASTRGSTSSTRARWSGATESMSGRSRTTTLPRPSTAPR